MHISFANKNFEKRAIEKIRIRIMLIRRRNSQKNCDLKLNNEHDP